MMNVKQGIVGILALIFSSQLFCFFGMPKDLFWSEKYQTLGVVIDHQPFVLNKYGATPYRLDETENAIDSIKLRGVFRAKNTGLGLCFLDIKGIACEKLKNTYAIKGQFIDFSAEEGILCGIGRHSMQCVRVVRDNGSGNADAFKVLGGYFDNLVIVEELKSIENLGYTFCTLSISGKAQCLDLLSFKSKTIFNEIEPILEMASGGGVFCTVTASSIKCWKPSGEEFFSTKRKWEKVVVHSTGVCGFSWHGSLYCESFDQKSKHLTHSFRSFASSLIMFTPQDFPAEAMRDRLCLLPRNSYRVVCSPLEENSKTVDFDLSNLEPKIKERLPTSIKFLSGKRLCAETQGDFLCNFSYQKEKEHSLLTIGTDFYCTEKFGYHHPTCSRFDHSMISFPELDLFLSNGDKSEFAFGSLGNKLCVFKTGTLQCYDLTPGKEAKVLDRAVSGEFKQTDDLHRIKIFVRANGACLLEGRNVVCHYDNQVQYNFNELSQFHKSKTIQLKDLVFGQIYNTWIKTWESSIPLEKDGPMDKPGFQTSSFRIRYNVGEIECGVIGQTMEHLCTDRHGRTKKIYYPISELVAADGVYSVCFLVHSIPKCHSTDQVLDRVEQIVDFLNPFNFSPLDDYYYENFVDHGFHLYNTLKLFHGIAHGASRTVFTQLLHRIKADRDIENQDAMSLLLSEALAKWSPQYFKEEIEQDRKLLLERLQEKRDLSYYQHKDRENTYIKNASLHIVASLTRAVISAEQNVTFMQFYKNFERALVSQADKSVVKSLLLQFYLKNRDEFDRVLRDGSLMPEPFAKTFRELVESWCLEGESF